MLFLLVLLVLVPAVELVVAIEVGQWIGAWETVALLLMVSFAGAWIVKVQGVSAWRRIRADLGAGIVPGASLVDGALLLGAGVLFLIPGFVTDAMGALLLVPPVRAGVRTLLGRRFRVIASVHTASGSARVYDVRSRDRRAPRGEGPADRPELGS